MARIRSLKPEIPADRKLATASRDARYTFLLLITQADDDGLFRAEGRQLLGALYPFDEDVTTGRLEGWLAELVAIGLIVWRRTRDGVRVGEIVNWTKHQVIKHRSKPFLLTQLAEPGENVVEVAPIPPATLPTVSGEAGGAESRVLSPESGVLSPESIHPPRLAEGKRFAELLNRMPATGHAKSSVVELLERVEDAQRFGWICSFLSYLDGADLPAGCKPTPEQLATACRDYMTVSPDKMGPAHFRSFLTRVVRDASRPVAVNRSSEAVPSPLILDHAGEVFDKILTMGESLPGGVSFSLKAIEERFGPTAKRAVKEIGGSNALANMRGADQRFLRDRFVKAYAASLPEAGAA